MYRLRSLDTGYYYNNGQVFFSEEAIIDELFNPHSLGLKKYNKYGLLPDAKLNLILKKGHWELKEAILPSEYHDLLEKLTGYLMSLNGPSS